jgi:AcrR family transcriptional regulator
MTKRPYRLKQRAVEMAETRRRITDAAVHLHETVGPARTTVSAIAELAGVQRHTVYRHFPTDEALFAACSAHYNDANPWPDVEAWRAVGDPRSRLARALDELYAYYERTEPMLAKVQRDLELVDAIRPALEPFTSFVDEATAVLAAGWGARGRRRRVLDATLRHALDFQMWRSLTAGDEIGRVEAVELAGALVAAAATGGRRSAEAPSAGGRGT